MSLYAHVPHPRIERRREEGPVKIADQLPTQTRAQRINSALAIRITGMVGSMWCAYVFSLLALVSLPAVLSGFNAFRHTFPGWLVKTSIIALVAWVAQTFLQLVLLSVIIVGQNIQAAASDGRAEQTYKDAEAVLQEALEIQKHLAAQDAALERLAEKMGVALESFAPQPAAGA
jgi:hypothetical protein